MADTAQLNMPAFILQNDRHRMLNHVTGLGLTMDVYSKNELCFVSLVTTESSLFYIRKGVMQVEHKETIWSAKEGEFLLLQAGVPLNITHTPSEDGVHEATGLFWERSMIAEHLSSDSLCFSASAHLLNQFDQQFYDSFTVAYHALQESDNLPSTIIAHRMREVLMWLSLKDLYFHPAEKRTLSAKLRDILTHSPNSNWLEANAAKALGRSSATLRRHLMAEGTSFREILHDVRMLYALRLLHSTKQPIGNIASSSGYACASRFTQSFYKRFGFHPSVIRGHKRKSSPNK